MAITILAHIEGTTPLLQHRFDEGAEVNGQKPARTQLVVNHTPREAAEKVVYRDKDGAYFVPGTWLFGCLCGAGANHKLRGSRRSARFVVPAAVRVGEVAIPLLNGDGKTPVADFETDSRPVTIPATKGRIMRHRPRFDAWSLEFTLVVNDAILPEDFVHQLLTEGGQQLGIGDFRPEKRGPFGCFRVTSWQRLDTEADGK